MLMLVVVGVVTWKEPPLPVNVPGVFVYGPVTTGELCSVNALLLSVLFVLLNVNVTFGLPTPTVGEMLGGGTRTVRVPLLLLTTPPAALVTPAV